MAVKIEREFRRGKEIGWLTGADILDLLNADACDAI